MAIVDPVTGLPTYQPAPVSPQFVGRFPGAPLPQAPVPVASNFVPRFATGPAGVTTGAPPAANLPTLGVTSSGPAAYGSGEIPQAAVAPVVPPVSPAQVPAGAAPLPTGPIPGVQPPLPPGMRVSAASDGTPQIDASVPIIRGNQAPASALQPGVEIIRGDQVSDSGTPAGAVAPQAIPGLSTGGLNNPLGAASAGFDRQNATANSFIDRALSYIQGGNGIFEQATRGRAIGNILHAVAGPNNAGQVFGSGADALNQSVASEANTAASVAGSEANVGTTTQAERDIAANRLNFEQQQAQLLPHPTGTAIGRDPLTGLGVPLPTYSFIRPGVNGGAPTALPISAQPPAASSQQRVVGATYTDGQGRQAVLQADGTYKPVGR